MSNFLQIDLHGHTADSAKRQLDAALKHLAPDVREIKVIHGYHQGTSLREVVRRYRHPKIERKLSGLNQGATIFVIKGD